MLENTSSFFLKQHFRFRFKYGPPGNVTMTKQYYFQARRPIGKCFFYYYSTTNTHLFQLIRSQCKGRPFVVDGEKVWPAVSHSNEWIDNVVSNNNIRHNKEKAARWCVVFLCV
jgi:hypothetical protein